jgi:hypothetical protein
VLGAFPRVLLLNLLGQAVALAITWVLGIVARRMLPARANPTFLTEGLPAGAPTVVMATLVVLGMLVGAFITLAIVPAAEIHVLDRRMRGAQSSLLEGLREALGWAWSRRGPLVLTLVLLLVAAVAATVVLLPFLLGAYMFGDEELLALGVLLAFPLVGATLGTFGLAIPVTVLEHRPAARAFGRAWELARLHPMVTAALGAVSLLGGALACAVAREASHALAHGSAVAIFPAVTFLLDMAWPAILVAAYHGLAAEEAKLAGRR